MNHLDVTISCFRNYEAVESAPVNLMTWLTSDKYAHQVNAIRTVENKKERDKIKGTLPAITPSGLFERRREDALIKHSGLIQFDIDGHHNERILNFFNLKEQLIKIKEIAYCGLSVSGRGFWGLIPISNPEEHKSHFAALRADFEKWGIILDDAPKSVASLRGYSYDPDAYFNHRAKVYTKLYKPKPERYRNNYQYNNTGDTAKRVETAINNIEAGRIDITQGVVNWFRVGVGLAKEFGEAGRGYFHRVSQYHPDYRRGKCDAEFNRCLSKCRRSGITIGTFFKLCVDHGVYYKVYS